MPEFNLLVLLTGLMSIFFTDGTGLNKKDYCFKSNEVDLFTLAPYPSTHKFKGTFMAGKCDSTGNLIQLIAKVKGVKELVWEVRQLDSGSITIRQSIVTPNQYKTDSTWHCRNRIVMFRRYYSKTRQENYGQIIKILELVNDTTARLTVFGSTRQFDRSSYINFSTQADIKERCFRELRTIYEYTAEIKLWRNSNGMLYAKPDTPASGQSLFYAFYKAFIAFAPDLSPNNTVKFYNELYKPASIK